MKIIHSLILLGSIFFLYNLSYADETITGRYCFTYGDRESLTEAREITRTLAIRNAIESYRVFVETTTRVNNFTLTNDILQILTSGSLKNITVEKHTETDRTICDTVKAIVNPLEVEKSIKRETQKKNKKVEETGIASNGCLKILSIQPKKGEVLNWSIGDPVEYTSTWVAVVLKAIVNTNEGICLRGNKSIVFIDYFDENGEPSNGDRHLLNDLYHDGSGDQTIRGGEIKKIVFFSEKQPKNGSFRVWLAK